MSDYTKVKDDEACGSSPIERRMCHLNPVMRETGFFRELFAPRIYVASSIGDFLDGRDEVRPTSWWNGFLWIPTFQIDNMAFVGKALISIMDVTYEESDYYTATISDAAHTLTLRTPNSLDFLVDCAKKKILPGDKVGHANIVYNPKRDDAYIVSFDKEKVLPLSAEHAQ